jgi:hypothetical protein
LDVVPLDGNLATEAVRRKYFGSGSEGGGGYDAEPVEVAMKPGNSSSQQGKGEASAAAGFSGSMLGAVAADQYMYYKFKHNSDVKNYVVEVVPSSAGGDADVFVSFTYEKPNLTDHHFANVDMGESTIHFSVDSKIATNTPFMYVFFFLGILLLDLHIYITIN